MIKSIMFILKIELFEKIKNSNEIYCVSHNIKFYGLYLDLVQIYTNIMTSEKIFKL